MRSTKCMQALAFSAPIAAMLASTIRMSRASMMSAERDVAGVVEEAPQRRDAGEQADLVAGRVEALGGGAAGELEVLGQFGAEELGGLVEVGGVGAGLVDGVAEVGLLGQQQAVDVLELRARRCCLAASAIAPMTAW